MFKASALGQRYDLLPEDQDDKDAYKKQSADGSEPECESAQYQSRKQFSWQHQHSQPTVGSRLQSILLLLNVIVLALSISTLAWVRLTRPFEGPDPRYTDPSLNGALKKTSSYSPIFDAIPLNPRLTTLNGHIRSNNSIFRRDPSPLVDAAWDAISTEAHQLITVSSAAVRNSHKTPELAVQAPSSWQRGPDAYVAQIDVFHQIHCLNELRKDAHWDYYYATTYPGGRVSVPHGWKNHKRHCLHMLLQNIMCHADVDVITHNWVRSGGQPGTNRPNFEPLADFSTVKQCRDFDALLDWARENAVSDQAKRWQELRWPEGTPAVTDDGYL